MPLLRGKSKKAFSHNVKTEMEHGHPQKQALAIAYSMKRRGKAYGGYAEGGETGYEKGINRQAYPEDFQVENKERGTSRAGHDARFKEKTGNELAKAEHRRVLSEMRSMKGPHGNYSHGGEVDGYQTADHELDMVGRIMRKRMAQGGEADIPTADFEENEFDYLDCYPPPEDHASAGNEMGNEDEDERRRDIVSRIMRARKMRGGHNPYPA